MRQSGFTLLELVFVLVILGITGVVGSGLVVRMMDAYQLLQMQTVVAQRGRLMSELIVRKINHSAPNSVRINSQGNCVEFLPRQGTAYYERPVTGQPVSSITLLHSLERASAYIFTPPSSEQGLLALAQNHAITAVQSLKGQVIVLEAPHRFDAEDAIGTLYLTGGPEKVCRKNGEIWHYRDYGVSEKLRPGGGDASLIGEVVEQSDPVFQWGNTGAGTARPLLIKFGLRGKKRAVMFERSVYPNNEK